MTNESISSEQDFVNLLKEKFPCTDNSVVMSIGDDCALTVPSPNTLTVTTTDTLVEDIHFTLSHNEPFKLGRKSLTVSLSDIASMGATPKHLLLSLSLPKKTTANWLEQFLDGLKQCTSEENVTLIGGNTTGSTDKISITTTLMGETQLGKQILRSTAKVGDLVFVTGFTGESFLGLKTLTDFPKKVALEKAPKAVEKHLNPQAQVSLGKKIAPLITSMTDISDGLYGDLEHILKDSNVGAKILTDKLNFSNEVNAHLGNGYINLEDIITGGEEYELVFTAPRENFDKIMTTSKELNITISQIGEITDGKGLKVFTDNGVEITPKNKSFDHFKETP